MLTDDDLTQQLGSAFRASSADLRYAGEVPTARRTPSTGWLVVPAVATAAALVVAGSVDDGTSPVAPEAGRSPSTSAHEQLVTSTIHVAGYTFTYRHAAGEALEDDLYGILDPGPVPDDATPIKGAPPEVEAYVGTDPQTGDHAMWVKAPTRNGGNLFALESPTWTQDQLTDLFLHGEPRTVPAAS